MFLSPKTVILKLSNLRHFNTIPHVVVTSPTIKPFSLLLHNYNFATVMKCNINVFRDRGFLKGL